MTKKKMYPQRPKHKSKHVKTTRPPAARPPAAQAAKPKPQTLSQRIFEAIQEATENGWSILAISNATGVPQPSLALWLSGQKPALPVKHLDTLQEYFGISIGPALKNLTPPKE